MNEFLDRLAMMGVRHPVRVIAASIVALLLCGAIASTMTVDSSRHTMVSEDNPHQALQMQYFERFGFPNTLIVVISGATSEARRQLSDDLSARLRLLNGLEDRVLSRVVPSDVATLLFLSTTPPTARGVDEAGYLSSTDGSMHYVVIEPQLEGTQQAHEVRPMIEAIRAERDAALADAAATHATLSADLTGPAALVVDEEKEIQRGIMTTSAATGLAILVLLFLAFRSVRYTLLGILPVILGVAATMAVARVLYGGLNMVTSSCSSILLGLGIDFGVFLLGRYGEFLRGGASLEDSIRGTVRKAGVGMAVGAVTTALAFLTTTATEFTAYARLGVIVALGLLLMMAATLILMPALLWLTGRSSVPVPPQIRGMGVLTSFVARFARPLVVAAGLLAVVALIPVQRIAFNTRFYDFIPAQIEGARALLAIETDTQVTPLRATVSAESIEEARALAAALRALPAVAAVQSPSDLLPELVDLDGLRARLNADLPAGTPENLLRAHLQAREIVERGHYVPGDIPAILQRQFLSLDGQAVSLQVVPRGNIWDPEIARQFYQQVISVAPQATGMAMHIDAHLRFIREGFSWAAAAAAILVLLTVWFSFRRFRDAALAIMPCILGYAWMFGVMGWSGFPFDAANIVVLPLILGIGVDAGVHMMHRLRQSEDENGVALLEDVVTGTGASVLLASATTFAGFAMLMLAEYGAMFSLGFLMSVGITSTTLASVLVLPALLVVLGRIR
jgi:predicted RND superfamily exporter protein